MLGKYGRLRKGYLKEHRQFLYQEYLLYGRLNEHLGEIDEKAYEAFNRLVDRMAKDEDVTEWLKAEDQILWVQKMNGIYDRANEIILKEYIYN